MRILHKGTRCGLRVARQPVTEYLRAWYVLFCRRDTAVEQLRVAA